MQSSRATAGITRRDGPTQAQPQAARNLVTNLHPSNPLADSCDLAGVIQQRYDEDLRRIAAAAFEDHQISVIERVRARLRISSRPSCGVLTRSQHDAVNAARAVDMIGFDGPSSIVCGGATKLGKWRIP